MYCPRCGKESPDGAKFCRNCGQQLVGWSPGKRDRRTPTKRLSFAAIAIVAIALIVACVVLCGPPLVGSIVNEPGGTTVPLTDDLYFEEPSEGHIVEDVETGIGFVDNELVIYCLSGIDAEQLQEIGALKGSTVIGHAEATNSYQIRLANPMVFSEVNSLCESIEQDKRVRECLPNYAISLDYSLQTADPVWNEAADEGMPSKTWGLECINAPEAWNIVQSDASVRVGIIDGQFYVMHEDLDGVFAETLPSSDGQFAISNKKGSAADDHGTHIAGIVAAKSNNVGTVGVAFGSSLYGYSLLGEDNKGQQKVTTSYGVEVGLTYLSDACGCSVINVSCGLDEPMMRASESGTKAVAAQWELLQYSYALRTSIAALIEVGGHEDLLICKSAGNKGNKGLADWDFLGCIDDDLVKSHIIMVGSVQKDGSGAFAVSPYSSCGERVDILAPGSDIYSTVYDVTKEKEASIPYSSYSYMSGTSMATPMVSGVAALVKAAWPDASGDQIKDVLCSTMQGSYADATGVSRGIVDALAAVKLARSKAGDVGWLASDFVRVWYDDWTYEDALVGNEVSDIDRCFTLIDKSAPFYPETTEGRRQWYSLYPGAMGKDFASCVLDVVAESVNSNTARVTVTYVGTQGPIKDQAQFNDMCKNRSQTDIWNVTLNDSGLVVALEAVEIGSRRPEENNKAESENMSNGVQGLASVESQSGKDIAYSESFDYDGDGQTESFFIVGNQLAGADMAWSDAELWFADNKGAATMVQAFSGRLNYLERFGDDSRHAFMSFFESFGGSGGTPHVFTVLEEAPVEVGFDLDNISTVHYNNGTIVGTVDVFDGYHKHQDYGLAYNESTNTFMSTGPLGESY